MEQQEVCQELSNYLRSAIGLLDFEQNSQLRKDVISICDYLTNPSFRIAVFGPFNYGKSTLLNALLGKRTLPIDLIPTTGAAISIKYGEVPFTRIKLADGREIDEWGTDILKQFAILDDQRRMRSDVASVQVLCPHPFLKTGVELLDLPGTNDREAQDALVRDQLLTADLVVQVLDARKLMTLGERENLRDWLSDRGIKTVVFVVNFLNLLEPEDQKQVYNRLLFVAESFRSELPNNISNLYRVDALPALRARLKGDGVAVQTTGLPMFESALYSIVAAQQENLEVRFPRVEAIASQVKNALQVKAQALSTELEAAETKRKAKGEIRQKAQKLIQKGFSASVSDFQSWLYLPKLLDRYQSEVALALQQGTFSTWERGVFKEAIAQHQRAIVKWVHQACEFFECNQPTDLYISFPEQPQVFLPESPQPSMDSKQSGDVAPVALTSGLGWLLGGPVGAAVIGGATYLLNQINQITDSEQPEVPAYYLDELKQAYEDAAADYLTRFSTQTFSTLRQYEESAEKIITAQLTEEPLKLTTQHHQLQLVQALFDNLNQEIESVRAKLLN
jgi:GTP-binding protein EngB required for normal cell division